MELTYNNIAVCEAALDFDNLGLSTKTPQSNVTTSSGGDRSAVSKPCRRFNAGNHKDSVITQEGITVTLKTGDIASQSVGALVNSVGDSLDLTSGPVAMSILTKAGSGIQTELRANRPSDFNFGDVITTQGYGLDASWVFHGKLKAWNDGKDNAEQVLKKFTHEVLCKAAEKKLSSVAIPALGTGNLSFPADVVASCLLEVIDKFSSENPNTLPLGEVRLVVYDKDTKTLAAFKQKLSEVTQTAVEHKDVRTKSSVPKPPAPLPGINSDPGISCPSNWTTPDICDPYRRVLLLESDPEYIAVSQNVQKTCGSSLKKIIKIERIECVKQYHQFMAAKNLMQQTCDPNIELERTLWHGTSKDVLDNIYADGFNRSYCGKNATFYGKGVYFAVNFNYSAQITYSPPDPATGHRYIFQCRVLTGHYELGTPDMIVPNIRTGKLRYDSVTNDVQNPVIFVIFRDFHAYPEYLVTFQ